MRDDIETFKNTVDTVSESILNGSVYTYWVTFTITTQGKSFSISTIDPDTRLIMSMDNTLNGSGCANSFDISLMYTPNIIPTDDSAELGGINYIDIALLNCNGECTLQYGYSTAGGTVIPTVEYVGRITSYKVEIRDAVLYYTIKGYSSIVDVLNNTISTVSAMDSVKPTKIVFDTLKEKLIELGKDDEYDVIDDGVVGTDQTVNIDEVTDTTLAQYVKTVLGEAVKEDEEASEDEDDIGLDRTIYSFYISDVGKYTTGKRSIVLYSYKSTDTSTNNELETDIKFTWMGARERFVTDFQVEFDGITLMCMRELTDKYSVDSSGALYTVKALSANATSGDVAKDDCTAEAFAWSKTMSDISYKAQITLMGIPCEKPIGSIISITPLLYGQPHITAGRYMITKSMDRIDMNTFTTQIDLIKMVSEDTILGFGTNIKSNVQRAKKNEYLK